MRTFLTLNDEPDLLPLLSAPRVESVYVDDLDVLNAAVQDLLAASGYLAVDAERASGFKYSQRAYLVQLYRTGSKIYLLDPIAFTDAELTQLSEFMADTPWILHAATQDLPCLAELGLYPNELFDTELISRLLGFERVGLGAVCELALGVRLAKEHSAADWSTRPLPANWLNYAALDVDVLPEMQKYLLAEIQAQGKEEIVAQEMKHLLRFQPKPAKTERWRSMSNFQDLREPRQLAVAKSMWEAREQLAQKLDVSPGRLVPDSSIVHVAKTLPQTKSKLIGDKSFNGRASRTYLDIWWQALDSGLSVRELPPMRISVGGLPNHRNWPAKFPEADARLQAAKEVIAEASKRLLIPTENILTPDYLRQLCFEPEGYSTVEIGNQLTQLGARPWQIAELADELSRALSTAKLPVDPAL